jgi:S1-C subfamily serine protease
VVSLNGQNVDSARQMQVNLYRYAVGARIDVEVLRNGSKQVFHVVTVERHDDPQRFADMVDPTHNLVKRLGILGIDVDEKVTALLPGLRKHYGVVVAARGGDAAYSGEDLQLGDVIYSVNAMTVTDVASLRKALDGLQDTDPLVLQVERDGRLMYVTMEVE